MKWLVKINYVDRKVEMVSFKLGEELRKMFFRSKIRFDSSWGLRIFLSNFSNFFVPRS